MTQASTAPAIPAVAARPNPAKIVVPRRHGEILIEPPFAQLLPAIRHPAPISDTALFGRPLAELRVAARAHFLAQATAWAYTTHAPPPAPDALQHPWVVTGHQVEFYHAGVWAKVVAADELAARAGGIAFDLLVDHDVVDELGFDVPTLADAETTAWKRTPVQWAPASPVPADGLRAPGLPTFEAWDAALAVHPATHTDALAFFLSGLRPPSAEREPRAYVPWLSQTRAAFERSMDLHVHHVPTSLLCSGAPWRTFVRAWIENADAWTARYNHHLAAYRKRQGITNTQHPMPDLARSGDTVELPFWIYKPGEARQRFTLNTRQATVSVDGVDRSVATLLTENATPWVIRPRALALTLFVRLFVADVFIHGIGGALYDQITDALIDDLFAPTPPAVPYLCVSAAWLLPLGQPLENSDDVALLRSRRHHVVHNPQLAIDPFTALRTEVAELIRDRRLLVEQIAASLAQAGRDPAAKSQRRSWFRELHETNERLHAHAPRILANLDHQIADARRAREQNKVLLWREYFFPLHTVDSLRKLVAAIHAR